MARVPNTATFSLRDVATAFYADNAAGRNLRTVIAGANQLWDATYQGSKNSQANLRNYFAFNPDGAANPSTASAIPLMTGYNTPSGLVSASNEYTDEGPAYLAWKPFDALAHTMYLLYPADELVPFWLQYQFATAKIINKMMMQCEAIGTSASAFYLQGSNNGSSWTTLLTTSGLYMGNTLNTYTFTNSTAYTHYRTTFTALYDPSNKQLNLLQLRLIEVS